MRSVLRRIASAVTRVELCTASICVAIWSVAFAVCTAKRQAVLLDVALVAHQNALVRVEQYDALRHVVENQRQKRAVAAGGNAAVTPPTHDHHRGKAHEDGHGVHLPALLQDDVQADPLPERGGRYTVASFY